MKKIILVFALTSIYSFTSAQVSLLKPLTIATDSICEAITPPRIAATMCTNAFSKAWDKSFGGTSGDGIYTMLNTTDRGYLLGGQSSSDADGDKSQPSQGGPDFWVVKTDSIGNKIWDRRFGGNDNDVLYSMLNTSDGGYLLGGYSRSGVFGDKSQSSQGDSDFWVVKIDANGNKSWDKRFGGNDGDVLSSMIKTADGGYLLGGSSRSGARGDKTQTSRGNADFWIVKIDANGNKVWDRRFGGDNDEALFTMLNTSDGGYLLGGSTKSGVNGDKTQPSHSANEEFWIVKIDGDGNKIWDKCFGGTGNESLKSMLNTSDGGYLLGGISDSDANGDISHNRHGNMDCWLMKINADGNKIWDLRSGKNLLTWLQSMIHTSDEGYLLGGFSRDATGYGDYWLVKVNANGEEIWDKSFGGDGDEGLFSMLNTPDGGFLVGGYSDSDISGDKSQPLNGYDNADYWILKTVPCSTISIICPDQHVYLIATGCTDKITWSTGESGSAITINTAGTYTAFCNSDSCRSIASNSYILQVIPTTASLNNTAANGIYKADKNIISRQNVPITNTVTYYAGNSISLDGTFQAQKGSVFKAEIKACTNTD